MVMTFDVVPYDAEIEAAYLRLFPDDKEQKTPEILRWRFVDNPHGRGFFSIVRQDGQIVGMIALIATKIRAGDNIVKGIQAVDTIVSPEAQGKFLFSRMGKTIYERTDRHDAEFVWGFPNALAKRGWFGRLGWTRFGMVPFVAKPIRTGYFLSRIAAPLGIVDIPISSFGSGKGSRFGTVDRFSNDVRMLCDRFNAEHDCALEYSPEFLNWRLIDCPFAQYRVVADREPDGTIRAIVSSIVVNKHDTRIVYLMEAISAHADRKHLKAMVRAEMRHARHAGASLALGWNFAHSPNSTSLRSCGFFALPERLRPVEIHFGAKLLNPDLPPRILDERAWYLSYLNSDTV